MTLSWICFLCTYKKMFGQKWPRYEKEIEKLLTLASNASALTLFILATFQRQRLTLGSALTRHHPEPPCVILSLTTNTIIVQSSISFTSRHNAIRNTPLRQSFIVLIKLPCNGQTLLLEALLPHLFYCFFCPTIQEY